MYVNWNPNPIQVRVSDCAVRAIAKALDISWEMAYVKLSVNGFLMGDIISSDLVWGAVLRENVFKRDANCPECETVKEFVEKHTDGVYVLKTPEHVVTAVDGEYFDTWDSGNEPVIYYWYKEE